LGLRPRGHAERAAGEVLEVFPGGAGPRGVARRVRRGGVTGERSIRGGDGSAGVIAVILDARGRVGAQAHRKGRSVMARPIVVLNCARYYKPGWVEENWPQLAERCDWLPETG
jgi:hypothetical protein